MLDTGINAYHDARDLLWRLAPAPFNVQMRIKRLTVLVQSNDPRLLALLANVNAEKFPNAEPQFLWRILRDPEAGGETEPAAILMDGSLAFLKMGLGVSAGVDKESSELLGFIGPGVSDRVFQECVAPILVQLTLDAAQGGARSVTGALELAFARGKENA